MFACVFPRATRKPPQHFATPETLLEAMTPYAQADVTGHWSDDRVMMAQALTWNTPQSRLEAAPEVCARTGRVIVSWVRLDNRDALCTQLGLDDAATLTDPQIILAAHGKWGVDCAAELEGDFSFVLYDPRSDEVFCARDAMGARPFYYALTDEVFVAATSLPVLRAAAVSPATLNQKWVALFLTNMAWADTETAFEHVAKLPSAHHMTVGRGQDPDPQRYHRFDLTTTQADTRDPIWVEQYRTAFERAVKDRARSAYLVGTENSGGLDSSSIAACLAEVLPHASHDFHCFGMAEAENEPELILAAANHCGIRHSHVQMKQEMLRLDEAYHRAIRMIGHPPEHGQMLSHPVFFELCEGLGIRTLHSGFGGDEIVTGRAREMFHELLARKSYGTLFGELPGFAPQRLARLGLRVKRGLPDLFKQEQDRLRNKLLRSCLKDEFLESAGALNEVATWVDPPVALPEMNNWIGHMPVFTRGRSARMESCALFAASYGVEYRWPMLDRRLIQQFLATPSLEKRHRDMGRYLHRRAMVGRVPDAILWQKSKYMGEPLAGQTRVAPRNVSDMSDLPGELRHIVDAKKFKTLLARANQHQTSAAPLDNFAVLELWQVEQLVDWLSGAGLAPLSRF